MGLLFALGVVLLVITLIGHGIWVAVAWMFRALFGDEALESGGPCLHCGAPYGVRAGRCAICGAVPRAFKKSQRDDELKSQRDDELRITRRQLKELCERGAIEQAQCDALLAIIDAELRPVPRQQPIASPALSAERGSTCDASSAQQAEIVDAVLVEPPPISAAKPRPSLHPLDRPVAVTSPIPPRAPGRSLADMLQSFMDESNIRWGEILAAALIVLCSVGLVVSLRNTLKNVPYFPAILFTLFTVAFHSAGLYTLRRWKLHAVSRVILIIALLLVPLTVCGAVVLQQTRPLTDPLFLVALLSGSGIFTWVSYSASRELVRRGAWPLAFGVLAPSLAQVLIQRLDFADGNLWRLNAASAIPLAGFLTATVAAIALSLARQQLSKLHVRELLRVLGIAAFAILPPLALILVRGGPPAKIIAHLGPQLSLAATAALGIGLLIHLRTTARYLAAWRTVGTTVVVLSSLILVLLVAAAWPDPELLLALALINCANFSVLAVIARLPVLYVPSVAGAAAAAVIGWHLAAGHFADRSDLSMKMVQAALMAQSSFVLTILCAAIAALAGGLAHRRRPDAQMLLLSSGAAGVLAVAIALFAGFVHIENPPDRDLAGPILLIYAAALIACGPSLRWRIPSVVLEGFSVAESQIDMSWKVIVGLGSALLWCALVQVLLATHTPHHWIEILPPTVQSVLAEWIPQRAVLTATVVHGAFTAFLAATIAGRTAIASVAEFSARDRSPRMRLLIDPLAIGAVVTLCAAVPFLCGTRFQFRIGAVLAAWSICGWMGLAAARRWRFTVVGMQLMSFLAASLGVAELWRVTRGGAVWLRDDWYQLLVSSDHLYAQLGIIAAMAAGWIVVRRLSSRSDIARDLFSLQPSADQALLAAGTIALLFLTVTLAIPGVGHELGLEQQPVIEEVASSLRGDAPAIASMPHIAGLITELRHGWIAWLLFVAAILVSLWERATFPALIELGIATFAAVWVAAALAEPATAASTARWTAAIYAIFWGMAYVVRNPLKAGLTRLPWIRWEPFPPQASAWFGGQPLAFGGTTILLITVLAVIQHLNGIEMPAPAAGSLFARIGATVSDVGPLVALVAVLLTYAICERSANLALCSAAVWQLGANLTYVLHASTTTPTDVWTVEWLQWNSIAAGGYALFWLGLSRFVTPPTASDVDKTQARSLSLVPVLVSFITAAVLALWSARIIMGSPALPPSILVPLGDWSSFLAVGLLLAALLWHASQRPPLHRPGDLFVAIGAGFAPLVAAQIHRFDPGGQWFAFHALEAGWMIVAIATCCLICWRLLPRQPMVTPHHASVAVLLLLLTFLAIRGNRLDPQQPWWSLATTVGCCSMATMLSVARRSQSYAYASTALAGLVVALLWAAPKTWPWIALLSSDSGLVWLSGVQFFTVVVCAMCGLWLWLEIDSQRTRDRSFDDRAWMTRVHAAALFAIVPIHFLVRLEMALAYPGPSVFSGFDFSLVLASLALGGLLAGCLWDRRAAWTLPLAYIWSAALLCLLIALCGGWLRGSTSLFPSFFAWRLTALAIAAAIQVALTGQLWWHGATLSAIGLRVGIDDPVHGLVRTERWLPAVNFLVATVTCIASLLLVLNVEQLPLRVAAAFGPLIVGWGIACLAQDERRDDCQLASLLIAGFTAVLLAWAQISPGGEAHVWLIRAMRLLMVLAALTFIYGLAVPRFLLRGGTWNIATQRAGFLAAAAALTTFAVILALEVALFVPGQGVAIDDLQIAAAAVILLALIAGMISLALLPGSGPLLLRERQAYVYAAEITATCLFAHLYLCRPFWFDSVLRPYWPFIVMGLAFAGVGAAELCQRYRIRVLAEPLTRSGALLPLLPVLGMWVIGSEVDYALLLLIVGFLYLALSLTQRSWLAMAAAALAGNGALWALLSENHFALFTNPQLWLIPPALSVLVASQLNRHRLTPDLLTAIRYGATIVIYVSSTSEIVSRGFAAGLAPPMVLLGLAVAGALAGIALRVRAFLMLGSAFTFVALTAMVRHAAQSIDHVWPWWVFGISIGVGILILFGVFEKKRGEVMLLIGQLRQWEQ